MGAVESTHLDLAGYYNAPVSFAYTVATCIASFIANFAIPNSKNILALEQNFISRGELWRLLTPAFVFNDLTTMSFGLYTIYYSFRVIERQFGSLKFASYLFITWLSTLICCTASFKALPFMTSVTDLPVSMITAVAFMYIRNVPVYHSNKLAGYISEKFLYVLKLSYFTYVAPIPTVAGITGALLWTYTPAKKYRFPSAFTKIVKTILGPFFTDDEPPSRSRSQMRLLQQRQAQMMMARAAAAAGNNNEGGGQGFRDQLLPGNNNLMQQLLRGTATTTSPPPEAAVEQLMSLGFDRETVLGALSASGNNVERAANRLLN